MKDRREGKTLGLGNRSRPSQQVRHLVSHVLTVLKSRNRRRNRRLTSQAPGMLKDTPKVAKLVNRRAGAQIT